jgi:hypothetical protein
MYCRPLMKFFINKTEGCHKSKKNKQYELTNILSKN